MIKWLISDSEMNRSSDSTAEQQDLTKAFAAWHDDEERLHWVCSLQTLYCAKQTY